MLALWSSSKLAILATQVLLDVVEVEVSPSMAFLVVPDFNIMPVHIKLVAYTVLLLASGVDESVE